jgi:hypothetical protein
MVLMAKERETTKVTPFGYYLSSLLDDRHYDNFTQYSERLHEVGRGCTPQMVSRYRRDQANVPLWFVADSIEALELNEQETEKIVGLWLDTLPPNQRKVMERLWKKNRPEQRDIRDLQDYERQREERGGENGDGRPPGDR